MSSVTILNGVLTIGGGAFSNCVNLASVTIPESVISIEEGVFASCINLMDVYCLSENVPITGAMVFYDSNIGNATLHVPTASVEAYKAAEAWNLFGIIEPLDEENAIADVHRNEVQILFEGGQLTLLGISDGILVRVYSINGILAGTGIGKNGKAVIPTSLPAGSFAIIQHANQIRKVIVR